MPAAKLGQFLRGLPEPLVRRARRLAELQQAYSETAPRALLAFSRVGAFQEGRVTLFAANGAVAAKLKQLLPELLLGLQNRGEVNLIEVKVQVSATPPVPAPPGPGTRKISPQGLKSVKQLAARLPPSPLRSALESLVAAQRRRRR